MGSFFPVYFIDINANNEDIASGDFNTDSNDDLNGFDLWITNPELDHYFLDAEAVFFGDRTQFPDY